MNAHEKQQRMVYESLMDQLETEHRQARHYLRLLALGIPVSANLPVPDHVKKRAAAVRLEIPGP